MISIWNANDRHAEEREGQRKTDREKKRENGYLPVASSRMLSVKCGRIWNSDNKGQKVYELKL